MLFINKLYEWCKLCIEPIIPRTVMRQAHRNNVLAETPLIYYVKASLPSKIINHYDFQKDIRYIAMELNVINKKYVIFSTYRPTT